MINGTFFPLDTWQLATFVALLAAVVGLWINPRFWWSCLGAATIFGYVAGVLHGVAIVWIALAGVVASSYVHVTYAQVANTKKKSLPRIVTTIAVTMSIGAMALLLGMHALPGFNNPVVVDRLLLSPDAEPFTLYLNFDKTLAGLLLLGVCYPQWRGIAGLSSEFRYSTMLLIAANVAVLIAASFLLGYLRFEPKWTAFFWLWAAANLFSTCLSEEAFFRGFIQRELQVVLRSARYGQWFALAISAMLFGLAHFAGGWRYVLLSSLAGVGYGYLYQRTRRIEFSMLAHFALNAAHFLLFTYPRLA